jgi:hypothetical protein
VTAGDRRREAGIRLAEGVVGREVLMTPHPRAVGAKRLISTPRLLVDRGSDQQEQTAAAMDASAKRRIETEEGLRRTRGD